MNNNYHGTIKSYSYYSNALRTAFYLNYFTHNSKSEIAYLTGMSRSTLEKAFHKYKPRAKTSKFNYSFRHCQPFFSLNGGKREDLPIIKSFMPIHFNRFFDLFSGSLSVTLVLLPMHPIINDINSNMINAFRLITNRDIQVQLINKLKILAQHKTKSNFYAIRHKFNQHHADTITQSAYFIYLQNLTHGGIFSVNHKGIYNSAFGNQNNAKKVIRTKSIKLDGKYLRKVKPIFLNLDFQKVFDEVPVNKNDFVFIDPPYYKKHVGSSRSYTAHKFNINDQKRVKKLCNKLTKKHVKFMAFNRDNLFIRNLYNGYEMRSIKRRSFIKKRHHSNKFREIMIRNY